jgi:hypothetical protein
MPATQKKYFYCSYFIVLFLLFINNSCGVYKFADVSVDPKVKTVRIGFIENRAQYQNPQLSPTLTNRIKQKITNQTRLSQTNGQDAHYDISGWISDYSVTTSAISNQQVAANRLTVGVHIILNNQLENVVQEFDISRSFEFSATLSLQAAEAQLMDEMIRNITDDIFNRIFSNW